MSSSVIQFDPSEVEKDNKKKYGQSLDNLLDEEVTIDNYENFMKRVKTYCGQIGDDITELQKEIQRLDNAIENLEDQVGEEKVEAYRESNRDLLDLSIGVEDTLAYRKLKKLKKIENKRSYKSAHWKLLAFKLEDIVSRLHSMDKVVRERVEAVEAEILKEIEDSQSAIVDVVETRADELSREHDRIIRLDKQGLKMSQDMSQHLSLGLDQSLTDNMLPDESEDVDVGDSDEADESNDVTSESLDKSDSIKNDSSESPEYELRNKSAEERKDELDRMVAEEDNLAEMQKDEIAELTDVSRQALFYSDKGGIVGEIEKQFTGVEYPELK